jgi:hypothetical protein
MMIVRSLVRIIAIIAEQIVNITERVEKIPWYWVGLFTSSILLIISVLVRDLVPNIYVNYYGVEYGAVGESLARGRGFSHPFSISTGTTAWVSPLLPSIICIIFFITKLKISSTYLILSFIKILSIGLGIGLIWDVLQKSNRGFAAICYLWMGILFYIYRVDLLFLFHDEWLNFLVISLAFWAWYHRDAASGRIILVVAFSAAALCNPILWGALLIVMLVFNRNTFGQNGESSKSCLRGNRFSQNAFPIAVGISFLLIIGWTARNWIQLGMFAPIKSNAGYEIFQAQMVSRNGVLDYSTFTRHPFNPTASENQIYSALGETVFLRMRRDMAIKSIVANPMEFYRRVANRFSNAFLYTASPANTAPVDSRICSDDLKRLRSAGFVVNHFHKEIWIDLDDPDKDLIKALPSLGLADPHLAQDDWIMMTTGNYWYNFTWYRIIGGCLVGGIPLISLLISILLQRREEFIPGIRWVTLFLFLYLMPYVLISHYSRYQVPLLGIHAILLTSGTVAIMRNLAKIQSSPAQPIVK